MRYLPILKSRLGELTALRQMADEIAESCLPLVDFVPGGRGGTALEPRYQDSLESLLNHWNPRFELIVDTHGLPGVERWNPTAYMVDGCAEAQMAVIPAVRLSDSVGVQRQVGAAVRRACHQSICIRVTEVDLLGENVSRLPARIDAAIDAMEKDPDSIHLVVDLGAIAGERDALHKARITRLALPYLPHIEYWQSITVAGGSFPDDLRNVPPKILTRLERSEVGCWRTVARQLGEKHGRTPGFGDYVVASPRHTIGRGFHAPPQLRYTVDNAWLVTKYGKNEQHARFFDICAEIAEHPEFTPGLTWGDREIEARSHHDRPPTAPGPGNATTWRAIGTSHHIGYIVDRITARGQR
ncbi:beta family protein [Nocardia sp. NPDC056100]|uniref:beta family protein n=1 Tax=Nocardia sp. NPDC056100 TaxID=3345712 RepID=UPI0035DF140C